MNKNKTNIEYNKILEFINSIKNYSDEEISKNFEDIYCYLYEVNCYELINKFKVLAIRAIRDLNLKASFIMRYFHDTIDGIPHYDWKEIIEVLDNSSEKELEVIFNILFTEINFEVFTKCLDIPNDLKFGIELEYCNVSFECIKKLFTNKMILPIMNAISMPAKLIDHIIENNDFEKKNEYDKWIFTKELINDNAPRYHLQL